jgi:glutathione S-transferase
LTETGFIVQYLLKNFPKAGLEATPSDDSVHWSFFSEGTLMLHLQPGRVLGFAAGALPKKPGVSAEEGKGMAALYNWFSSVWVGKNVPLQLQCVEDFLAQNPNLSGSELIGSGDVSTVRDGLGGG